MGAVHGKAMAILAGGYALTAYTADISTDKSVDTADVSVIGTSSKQYVVGDADGKISLSGFFDAAQGASDERFKTMFGTAGNVVSVAWAGAGTVGNPATLGKGIWPSYKIAGGVGKAVGVNAEFVASGGLDYGVFIKDYATNTFTDEILTAWDFGATSTSSSGYVANLHVTAATGSIPTLAVKLQDSANNSAWADVSGGGFTTANDVFSQQLSSATISVRRYVRVEYTITGTLPSFTWAVTFAKR